MNSYHDTAGDEPIEPRTRQTLWRLRARLVTPSPEPRVDADLEAMLAAAAVHAHDEPDLDASPRPGPDPQRTDDEVMRPRLVIAPTAEVVPLTQPRRRFLVVEQVGRVAAVVVLVAAVGGGAAAIARDGEIHLQALLGRSAAPDPAEEIVAAPPVDDVPATPDATAAPSVEDPEPLPDPVLPVVPEVAPPAGDAAGADDVDVVPPPTSGNDAGTAAPEGGSNATGSGGAATPSPSAPSGNAPGSGTAGSGTAMPSEPAPEPPSGEVIAAPAPDDLAGAGGPQPCDAEQVRDCLPQDDTSVEDVDPDEARDELVQRRAPAPPRDED